MKPEPGMSSAKLGHVAQINPRSDASLAPDDIVSFVPMAAVSAVTASVEAEERRNYAEVAKGYTAFRNGDLLVAKITPCFENNKIAHARLSGPLGFGSTEFHVVRPHPDRLDPRYALHFLRQDHVRAEGERKMTGSAGQRRVPAQVLADLTLPLPPLSEQRRIAAILDEADALRAKRRAALAQLDEMAQAIFGEMFGDPIENPRQLPVVQLSSVIASDRPITYGILKPGPDIPDGVPYVRVVDMAAGQVRLEGIRRTSSSIAHEYRRSTLRSGDLLISIRGHVGRVAVTPSDLDGANITQDTARLAVVGACPIYLQGILESPPMREWMDRRTKGAAVQGINLGDLKQMPILLPPPEEQLAFANRVSELRVIADRAAAQVGAFDSLFSSLQHRAFRGEL